MEIIIGRDATTSKLKIINGNQQKLYGSLARVPMDVSRQHCQIIIEDEETLLIKNIKAANVTYVNGIEIQTKKISKDDIVELGVSRYQIPLKEILNEIFPKTIDISILKPIWEQYEQTKLEYSIAERKFNAARSAVGVITMLAIACSFILGHGPVYLAIYGIAIVASLAFAIAAYRKSSENPIRIKELTKTFQRTYVCPHCHHFMVFQDYDILAQNDSCPYCKIVFNKNKAK